MVTDRSVDGNSVSAPAANAWDSVFSEGVAVANDLTPEQLSTLGEESPPPETQSTTPAEPVVSDTPAEEAPQAVDPTLEAAPETPAIPADPNADPLAGAEVFSYTGYDGQPKTIDGAYYLKGDGLYIPDDKVAAHREVYARAELLDQQVRAVQDQNQTWERLATWKETDANGQDRVLTGRAGYEAMRLAGATTSSALGTILTALNNPESFARLYDQVQGQDGQWYVVRNENEWKALMREASLNAKEATYSIRDTLGRLSQAPPPAPPSVAQLAMPTVEQTISAHGITGLNEADKKFLASHLESYVRQATPQERQQYGSDRIVDGRFIELMKDRAAQRAEIARAAQNGTKAQAFNNGMKHGIVTPPKAAAARTDAPVPTGRLAPKIKTEPSPNSMWADLIAEAQQAG